MPSLQLEARPHTVFERRDHNDSVATSTIVAAAVGTIGGLALVALVVLLVTRYWKRRKLQEAPKPEERLAQQMRRWSFTTQDARRLPQLPLPNNGSQTQSSRKYSSSTKQSSRSTRELMRSPPGTTSRPFVDATKRPEIQQQTPESKKRARTYRPRKEKARHQLEQDFEALERDISKLSRHIEHLHQAAATEKHA